MPSLDIAPIAGRIVPILARLDSPHPSERAACVDAIARVLNGQGLKFVDLAAAVGFAFESPSQVGDRAKVARARASEFLTTWESAFVASLANQLDRLWPLSPKQRARLHRICDERSAA